MPKVHDIIVKKISTEFNMDIRVVDRIVRYPLLFTANKIRNSEDKRPIMLRYWGKFILRLGKLKR